MIVYWNWLINYCLYFQSQISPFIVRIFCEMPMTKLSHVMILTLVFTLEASEHFFPSTLFLILSVSSDEANSHNWKQSGWFPLCITPLPSDSLFTCCIHKDLKVKPIHSLPHSPPYRSFFFMLYFKTSHNPSQLFGALYLYLSPPSPLFIHLSLLKPNVCSFSFSASS